MKRKFSLEGKTILVTGASSGIGQACTQYVADMGGAVILSGRDISRLRATHCSLNGVNHQVFPGDLNDFTTRQQLIQAIPSLDGVVFAAGINKLKPARFVDAAFLTEQMNINFTVPYLMTCELLKVRKIKDGASVIFIGSIAAHVAQIANSVYSATKGALISAMRVLAVENSKQQMRFNVLSPGQVRTPMTTRTEAILSPKAMLEYESQYPLGFGDPADLAGPAVFLLSDASRWLTGQEIIIDGGFTLK